MTNQTTLTTVADGDQMSQGYFNELFNSLNSSIVTNLVNQMNSTEVISYPYTYVDILTSDSADTKTNWTYDATNDWYAGQTTSLATLEFQNILNDKQLDALGTTDKALLYVAYDYSGDLTASIVGNPSFETAGGGGADVFGSWTESAGTGTWSQSTSNNTAGTYSARYAFSGTAEINSTGTLTQTVDCTNVKFISIDYTVDADATGSGSACQTVITFDVGGISDSSTVQSNVGNGYAVDSESGTYTLDVSSLTGNQTITLTVACTDQNGGGGGTQTHNGYFDNILTYSTATSDDVTTTFYLSPNGSSSYEVVSNGVITTLASPITQLGVKVEETNTGASSTIYSKVKAIGVFLKQ